MPIGGLKCSSVLEAIKVHLPVCGARIHAQRKVHRFDYDYTLEITLMLNYSSFAKVL